MNVTFPLFGLGRKSVYLLLLLYFSVLVKYLMHYLDLFFRYPNWYVAVICVCLLYRLAIRCIYVSRLIETPVSVLKSIACIIQAVEFVHIS